MVIDVVAHVLDEFRNEVCSDRCVLAALDSNATRTIVPRVGTDPRKRFPLQTEDKRRPEFERPSIKGTLNCADRGIILPKAISCFGGCPCLGL